MNLGQDLGLYQVLLTFTSKNCSRLYRFVWLMLVMQRGHGVDAPANDDLKLKLRQWHYETINTFELTLRLYSWHIERLETWVKNRASAQLINQWDSRLFKNDLRGDNVWGGGVTKTQVGRGRTKAEQEIERKTHMGKTKVGGAKQGVWQHSFHIVPQIQHLDFHGRALWI